MGPETDRKRKIKRSERKRKSTEINRSERKRERENE